MKVTRVRRDSSGVRKSMAMANPQVIQKEIQKATQTVSFIYPVTH